MLCTDCDNGRVSAKNCQNCPALRRYDGFEPPLKSAEPRHKRDHGIYFGRPPAALSKVPGHLRKQVD